MFKSLQVESVSATTVILPLGKSPSARMLVKHRNRAAWREPCDRELNTELAKSMLVPLHPAVLTQQDCSMQLLPRHTTVPLIGTPRHRIGLSHVRMASPPDLRALPPTRDQGGEQSFAHPLRLELGTAGP